MGRQVNFFLAREDEPKFLEFVMGTGKTFVFSRQYPTIDFRPVDRLPNISWPPNYDEIEFWFFNYDVSDKLTKIFNAQRNSYTFDTQQSSIVQFWRSFTNGRLMYPGRIWADMNFFLPDRKVFLSKEKKFIKWFEEIAKWIKAEFRHVTVSKTGKTATWVVYLSPGITTFQNNGGMLSLNPPIRGKDKEVVLDRTFSKQVVVLSELGASICADWPRN